MPRRFKITDAHMAVFSEQQRQRFEDDVVAYVAKHYPDRARALGEGDLRMLIRDGIEKAKEYDILLERDVARYIEFMVALSPDFDDSPNTPWAQPILTRHMTPGRAKLDQIEDKAFFGDEEEGVE